MEWLENASGWKRHYTGEAVPKKVEAGEDKECVGGRTTGQELAQRLCVKDMHE